MKRRLISLAPLTFVIIASLYSVYPSIVGFKDSLVYLGDDVLITWVLNQNIQKIPYGLRDIFQGNIFFPIKNTILFSHVLLPSSLIGYLPVKITGSFASAFNSAHIFGQISSMVILYLWFKDMFKDSWAAAVGSIAFGLSQIHLIFIAHLHVWNMQWWLTALWMMWRFSKNGKVWQLYIAGIMLSIQIWENPLEFYRVLLPAILILLPKIREIKKVIPHILKIMSLMLLIVSPYLIAYIGFIKEYNYVRPIRDIAHFSISLDHYWDYYLSPGLYSLFLLSFIVIGFKRLKSNPNFRWLSLTAITSFILSFGPVFKWQEKTFKLFGKIFIPLPYLLLYYTIPGFQAMRTPPRWALVVALGMSGIIALAISQYKGRNKGLVVTISLVFAVVGGIQMNFNPPKVPDKTDFPKVYDWLGKQEGDGVLEYPMYTWASVNNGLQKEFLRMYFSLEHKKSIVNGGSGYMPPERQKFIGIVNNDFPEEYVVNRLIDMGVEYVIVHKSEINSNDFRKIDEWGRELMVYEDDNGNIVYKLP